jgi:hypothetical protein
MSTPEQRNSAMTLAKEELKANWKTWSAHAVAEWAQRWYVQTGYGNLAVCLIDVVADPPPGTLRLD